jgi:hypothetical protein
LRTGFAKPGIVYPKPTSKLELNNRHDWLIVTIKLELGGDRTDGCEHPQTAHTRIG